MEITVIAMIGFLVAGEVHEDVVGHMPPAQCAAFVAAVERDLRSTRKMRLPTVELRNGKRVPVVGAGCLAVCMDELQPLELITKSEDA